MAVLMDLRQCNGKPHPGDAAAATQAQDGRGDETAGQTRAPGSFSPSGGAPNAHGSPVPTLPQLPTRSAGRLGRHVSIDGRGR